MSRRMGKSVNQFRVECRRSTAATRRPLRPTCRLKSSARTNRELVLSLERIGVGRLAAGVPRRREELVRLAQTIATSRPARRPSTHQRSSAVNKTHVVAEPLESVRKTSPCFTKMMTFAFAVDLYGPDWRHLVPVRPSTLAAAASAMFVDSLS